MSNLFSNHSAFTEVLKHRNLPLWMMEEFDFYRCIKFNDAFYGKTVSELHRGNLRPNDKSGRHSVLFPNEKISYWADSAETAKAETKKHKMGSNLITFWSYDDASSTFPTCALREPLIIIDGVGLGFASILAKYENDEELSKQDRILLDEIMHEKPDCLAYHSHANKGSTNFLFFEKGFTKLALRQVRLRLGERNGNSKIIFCADFSDYHPFVEAYGKYFEPIARVGECLEYRHTSEYMDRNNEYEKSLKAIGDFYGRNDK